MCRLHLHVHACLECNQSFEHTRGFKLHLFRSHGLTRKDYVIVHFHGGVHPTCECGCGQQVKWWNDERFHRLVRGHYTLEMREKQRVRRLGKSASIETLEKQSISGKIAWKSKERRDKQSKKLMEFHLSSRGDDWSIEQSKKLKEFNATEEGKAIRKAVGTKLSIVRATNPELWPSQALPREKRACASCGTQFDVAVSKITKKPRPKFCSNRCKFNARVEPRCTKLCVGCGDEMIITKRQRLTRSYCNVRCARGSNITRENMSKVMSQQHIDGLRTFNNVQSENGWIMSTKLSKSVWYRSSYERRYIELLELDDNVVAYKAEPMRIPYQFNGITKNYVPDFLITHIDGSQLLVEVKPDALTNTQQNLAKQKAAQAWCVANNVTFVTVTEEQLFTIDEAQHASASQRPA